MKKQYHKKYAIVFYIKNKKTNEIHLFSYRNLDTSFPFSNKNIQIYDWYRDMSIVLKCAKESLKKRIYLFDNYEIGKPFVIRVTGIEKNLKYGILKINWKQRFNNKDFGENVPFYFKQTTKDME